MTWKRSGCSVKTWSLVTILGALVLFVTAGGATVVLGRGVSVEHLTTPGQLQLDYQYEGVGRSTYLVIRSGKKSSDWRRFDLTAFPIIYQYDVPEKGQEEVQIRYLWFGYRGLDQITLHLWQSKNPENTRKKGE